jgi:hypothetical protein
MGHREGEIWYFSAKIRVESDGCMAETNLDLNGGLAMAMAKTFNR